jgi:hypothetical protein
MSDAERSERACDGGVVDLVGVLVAVVGVAGRFSKVSSVVPPDERYRRSICDNRYRTVLRVDNSCGKMRKDGGAVQGRAW